MNLLLAWCMDVEARNGVVRNACCDTSCVANNRHSQDTQTNSQILQRYKFAE